MKNVTGIGQLIRNRLNMSHELEGQEIIEAKKKLSAVSEDKVRLVKNGHTYKVVLTWRGKTYMIQMFVPSVSRPTRQTVEKEIQKVYPDSKVLSFLPKEFDPANPTVMVGEMAELPKFKGLTRKDASASFRDNTEINNTKRHRP